MEDLLDNQTGMEHRLDSERESENEGESESGQTGEDVEGDIFATFFLH